MNEYAKDELISIGLRYVRRASVASRADIYYWAEIPIDEKLAQQILKFLKAQPIKKR